MRPPRFYMTDNYGLILETPIALTPMQREAARQFAIKEYKRRLIGMPSGDKRDSIVRVIDRLNKNNFMERPVPKYDSEKEITLHG